MSWMDAWAAAEVRGLDPLDHASHAPPRAAFEAAVQQPPLPLAYQIPPHYPRHAAAADRLVRRRASDELSLDDLVPDRLAASDLPYDPDRLPVPQPPYRRESRVVPPQPYLPRHDEPRYVEARPLGEMAQPTAEEVVDELRRVCPLYTIIHTHTHTHTHTRTVASYSLVTRNVVLPVAEKDLRPWTLLPQPPGCPTRRRRRLGRRRPRHQPTPRRTERGGARTPQGVAPRRQVCALVRFGRERQRRAAEGVALRAGHAQWRRQRVCQAAVPSGCRVGNVRALCGPVASGQATCAGWEGRLGGLHSLQPSETGRVRGG